MICQGLMQNSTIRDIDLSNNSLGKIGIGYEKSVRRSPYSACPVRSPYAAIGRHLLRKTNCVTGEKRRCIVDS